MEAIAEFFIEVFFGRFIIRFLGVRARYLCFRLIGKKVTLKELKGDGKDIEVFFTNDLANAFAGLVTLGLGIAGLAYLFC